MKIPYLSASEYYKSIFGQKIYKISLDAGCTCPTRDGTKGTRGCIFCSAGGSGDFAGDRALSIKRQLEEERELVSRKHTGNSYIAYFQAYTNTYAPLSHLRRVFTESLKQPEIAALSIGTRCDCLSEEVLDLLEELALRDWSVCSDSDSNQNCEKKEACLDRTRFTNYP